MKGLRRPLSASGEGSEFSLGITVTTLESIATRPALAAFFRRMVENRVRLKLIPVSKESGRGSITFCQTNLGVAPFRQRETP